MMHVPLRVCTEPLSRLNRSSLRWEGGGRSCRVKSGHVATAHISSSFHVHERLRLKMSRYKPSTLRRSAIVLWTTVTPVCREELELVSKCLDQIEINSQRAGTMRRARSFLPARRAWLFMPGSRPRFVQKVSASADAALWGLNRVVNRHLTERTRRRLNSTWTWYAWILKTASPRMPRVKRGT